MFSENRLYELFVDTAQRCGSHIAELSDEEVAYNLFEEFDVGARAFFYDGGLDRLSKAGMITPEVVSLARKIRTAWIELDHASWTVREIRLHSEWKRLFSLCDRLLRLLRAKGV